MIQTRNQKNDSFSIGFSLENNNIYYEPITYQLQGGNTQNKERYIMGNPIEDYGTYLRGKYDNEETINNYLKHIKVFADKMDWRIKRLTQEDVDEYVQWFKHNRSHNGNTSRFNAVKNFLAWQGRYDLILPKQKMLPTNKHALTKEQMIQLCETARVMSWLHQLVLTLELICLRRPKDIRNLKINDKQGDILRYVDKTSRFTGIKMEVLSKWATKSWDNYIYFERPTPKTDDDAKYLILSDCQKFYGQHLTSNVMINRIACEIQKQSRIPTPNGEKIVNYLFKRTGITQQAHICPNIKIVKEQAGHSKIESTLVYDRIQDDDTRKHLDSFEEVISRKDDYNRIQTKPEGVIKQKPYSWSTNTWLILWDEDKQ
jgi:hypothetical protein